jgi:4,5-DOPA dioxygenase extradiol
MKTLKDLKSYTDGLAAQDAKMPVLFLGHGSPMNAIEENEFTKTWNELGTSIPKPKAILCISAHWETKGTFVTAMEQPRTIHDFGGFPQALFNVQYPAPGSPEVATEVQKLIRKTELQLDHEWGLDHGTWSIIKHIYPDADVPVLQLSLDYSKPAQWHYELAKELAALRNKGVLIIGSGNVVHNLRMLQWHNPNATYDWAVEMNEAVKNYIVSGNHEPLIKYDTLGKAAALSIPSPEHYLPLLYTLGLQEEQEKVTVLNDMLQMGAIAMTSFKMG